MTTGATRIHGAARERWSWRLLTILGILMILDGAWLATSVGGPALFEGDTGVAMSEVSEAYPSVVEVMNRRGRLLGVLVAGLGMVVSVASLGHRRRDARATVAVVGVTSLAVAGFAGSLEVAVVYAVFGFWALAGAAWTRPPTTP